MFKLTDITFTYPMSAVDAEEKYDCYGSGDEAALIIALDPDDMACGYIEVQKDGSYYTICEREELITRDFHEAAKFLFNNWIKYL